MNYILLNRASIFIIFLNILWFVVLIVLIFLGIIACLTNKISPSDFVGSWIAYCASSQNDANDLNKESLFTLVKLLNKENTK